jgi:hypothetical protein
MLVISQNLVLSEAEAALDPNCPLIAWENVITAAGITAESEDPDYPASNLANALTHSQAQWRSATTAVQKITFTISSVDPIDSLCIAGHNFGTAEAAITIGYYDGSLVWHELVEEMMPADDKPLMFRFTEQSLSSITIALAASSQTPRAAVVYVGKLLVVERRLYVGHTPLPYARKVTAVNGRSEAGNYLGRIVLQRARETTIPFQLISPEFYREKMDGFLAAATEDTPFFFAWRPDDYPLEVGFCWLTDDPMPVPTAPSNRIAFDLKVGGIA